MQQFLIAFLCLMAIAVGDLQETVTAVSAKDDSYRQLSVEGLPSLAAPTKLSVAGVAADVGENSATLDVAGFSLTNPANNGGGMDFYFGLFNAKGDWQPTSQTASIEASLNEVVASFTNVYTWLDYDGAPGFQYKLGNDAWDCAAAATGKFDCISDSYELKALTWGTISTSELACPDGYQNDCKIYNFKTTGSSALGNVSFTFKLASQPVIVNQVRIEPSFAKIDIEIIPNWGTADPNSRLGIAAFVGGKSVSGGIEASRVGDDSALVFSGNKNNAYFSWAGLADVGKVYASSLNFDELANYQCTGCGLAEGLVIAIWKAIGAVWEGFGWKVQLVWFSWDAKLPASVLWDPKIGATSGVASAQISVLLLAASLLAAVARAF